MRNRIAESIGGRASLPLAFASALLMSCASPAPVPEVPVAASQAEMIMAGKEIAVASCGSCHDVESTGPSPLAQAPPFARLSTRYRLDVLREELQQGVHVGAAEMPKFTFSIAEIDALSAYLQSVQRPGSPPEASIE